MQHDEGTIEKLVLMQYNTFQLKSKIIKIVISIAMLVYGVVTIESKMFTSYICLFLGSVMIAGLNVRPKSNAKKLSEQMKGRFPSSDYRFSSKGFRDSEKSKEIPYKKLVKLIDDKTYLYLYVSEESAYMVRNASVKGEDRLEGLKKLLSDKSGLKWSRSASIWSFNIGNVRELMASGGAGGSAYVGERLGDRNRRRWF